MATQGPIAHCWLVLVSSVLQRREWRIIAKRVSLAGVFPLFSPGEDIMASLRSVCDHPDMQILFLPQEGSLRTETQQLEDVFSSLHLHGVRLSLLFNCPFIHLKKKKKKY